MFLVIQEDKSFREQAREEIAKAISEVREERAAVKRLLPIIERIRRHCPGWVDVRHVTLRGNHIDLYLGPPASSLPRDIAREFGARGEKKPMDGSLYVSYTIETGTDLVTLDVNGYVPATCKVVEVEEFVPGSVRKIRKVVCTDNEPAVTS